MATNTHAIDAIINVNVEISIRNVDFLFRVLSIIAFFQSYKNYLYLFLKLGQ